MSIKKYVLIGIHELTTTVTVDGKPRIVNFSGGSRVSHTRGFLVTSNQAMQSGIEESSGFNSVYKLATIIEESPSNSAEDVMDARTLDLSVIHETTVTSKNKAIKYLLDTHGAVFIATTSIEEMKREVLEKYNTVFVNW